MWSGRDTGLAYPGGETLSSKPRVAGSSPARGIRETRRAEESSCKAGLTAYACGAGRRREDAAPGCAEYVAQMRAMAGSLGGPREDAIPADLREAVLAAFCDVQSADP
jgi:hypothetical protein